MASEAARKIVFKWNGPIANRLRRFFWETTDSRKYGLLFHDTVNETVAEVAEALRRLPPHLYDARMFRIMRAANLQMHNEILPKDQWAKWEDETFYLKPYWDEVLQEIEQQKKWTGVNPKWKEEHRMEMQAIKPH